MRQVSSARKSKRGRSTVVRIRGKSMKLVYPRGWLSLVSKLQSLLRDSTLAGKGREWVAEERSGWPGKSTVASAADSSGRESG